MAFGDGSGISWTICKQSATLFRQITTPTPCHSILMGRMLFVTPNQRCQSSKSNNPFIWKMAFCVEMIVANKWLVMFKDVSDFLCFEW